MLFLGLLFERCEEKTISKKSKGIVQNQVNTFQWNCIDGLYENDVNDLCIINALPVGTYPKQYSDIVLRSKKWSYNGGVHHQIGCINLPILKQWGRYRACRRLIKKSNAKDILIYSAYQPFLKAIRKLDKSYNVTLIVPDLPEYYDYAKASGVRKLLRKINNRSIYSSMSRVDKFVLLTEAMKEPLKVGKRPYTVVEGICSAEPPKYIHEVEKEKKTILYAGSLNERFGIATLMDAFEKIENSGYELWICGSGDYVDDIKARAKNDERIKFFGFVTKEEVVQLQSRATVLVNPRQNIGEYTKYSFPSKTMEYMLSGIPVIAYKLDGIPDEYDKYFNYVEGNSPQNLCQKIRDVCEDVSGKYESIAKQAVDFVMNEKGTKKQALKILELMNNK